MKQLLFLISILFCNTINGQDFVPIWSGYMSTNLTAAPNLTALETDMDGNVYYVGNTAMNTYFNYDPFGGILNMSPVGGLDCFIVKISSDGEVLWGKTIGGSQEDVVDDIAIDNLGNIHITGTFQGTVDFNPGEEEDSFTAPNNGNQFILKLDEDGNYIWNKTIEGPFTGVKHVLSIDHENNVLISGYFTTETMDFDPGPAIFNLPYTSGADIFVLKLDNNGDFLWAKAIGGDINEVQRAIATDTLNNVFIAGDFMESADFDPGEGEEIRTSVGDRDLFLLKLDEQGDFQWVHTMGSEENDLAAAVQTDLSGNVYFTGDFHDTVDFGIDGMPMPLTSVSEFTIDMFLQKLDPSGVPIWVKQIGGPSNERPKEIKIDESSNIFIGGSFTGTVDFDPGPGVAESTVYSSDDDTFILKLNSLGEYMFHATTYQEEDEYCSGIALGPDETIYLAGNFDGYVDLSLGQDTDVHGTGSNVVKPYMAKYHQCTAAQSTDTIVSCDSFEWPLTGLTYTNSNIYESIESDVFGCDSTVFLDLTINSVNNEVNLDTFILSAEEENASYQWIDCDTDLPIDGETGQSFTVTENGNYAVLIDDGMCTGVSDCFVVQVIGMNEFIEQSVPFYPNPANEFVYLELSGFSYDLKMVDLMGNIVLSKFNSGYNDLSRFENGTYVIVGTINGDLVSQRIVVLH